jgi:hypothetical protein
MNFIVNIGCYEFKENCITKVSDDSTLWGKLTKERLLNKFIYRERKNDQYGFSYEYRITDKDILIPGNLEENYIGKDIFFKLNQNWDSPDIILVFTYSAQGQFKNDLHLYNDKSSYLGALQIFRANSCKETSSIHTHDFSTQPSIDNYDKQVPIITLCPTNIMQEGNEDIDKRKRFLDGSIWHRFIHLAKSNPQWEENLAEVIWDICYWNGKIENGNTKNFYDDIGAREYLEYSLRLLANSWIDPGATGGSNKSGHSTQVNPLIFNFFNFLKN